MDMSSSSGRYMDYSPFRYTEAAQSPHNVIGGSFIRSVGNAFRDEQKYLSDLLHERQKIQPFIQVLPHSYLLLNREILRVTSLLGNASVVDQTGLEHGSPLTTRQLLTNIGGADMSGWASTFQSESLGLLPSLQQQWVNPESGSSSPLVKKLIRLDIPVDKYPSYNFMGRLLGPRGNSLKRIEAATGCRVFIRGRGSIKDSVREEMMRGKPGYVHLNEPLHVIIEAELPVEIVDARLTEAREILQEMLTPVDDAQDYLKKQQLRELAILNGTLREDGSHSSGSLSPFHDNLGMKRSKTRD